jgi:GNAT superfamily N-acetyltransferase
VVRDLVGATPGMTEQMRGMHALMSMVAVAKIKALAVDPPARGQGIAAALLRRAVQLYRQLGFHILYGQFPEGSGLERFDARNGFQVLGQGEGAEVGLLLTGVPMTLRAGPRERMFQRWIQ